MKDEISALMDGELDAEAADGVIAQIKKTDGLRAEWVVYHLISDALGQSEAMPADITRRVSARLAAEPAAAVLAPRPSTRHKTRVYAAAASVAAVAVIGWMSLQTTGGLEENLADNRSSPATTNTAALQPTQPNPAVVSVSASIPPPDEINHYLLAHGQFSSSAAVHGVAPYMRTVAESRENAAR